MENRPRPFRAPMHASLQNAVDHLVTRRRVIFLFVALTIAAIQIDWALRLWRWLGRHAARPLRWVLAAIAVTWYAAGFVLTFRLGVVTHSAVELTLAQAVLAAPFQVWLAASIPGFFLIWIVRLALVPHAAAAHVSGPSHAGAAPAPELATPVHEQGDPRPRPAPAATSDRATPPQALAGAGRSAAAPRDPLTPGRAGGPGTQARPGSRRDFLKHAGAAAAAIPFLAGAYGAAAGRLEIETTHPRIHLEKLPAALDGFRIAQLSDIHIGPFMSAGIIRRCVEDINALRPDLVVLTGDFVTWDPSTQYAAVAALRNVRAPFGVYGCLGNHEIYTHTQSSITRLFAQAGVKILRQQAAMIRVPALAGIGAGARMQLLGVDFIPRGHLTPAEFLLASVPVAGGMVRPEMVNILLAHDPNCFDRAAQLGIDLTISGHTHGGQIAFFTPELSPARLITPYVAGHFRRGASQLYVNRGLGTIGMPIRLFAPPEITVYELKAGRARAA